MINISMTKLSTKQSNNSAKSLAVKITPLSSPIHAKVFVPGSLSYTIRALAIASLVKGSVTITNALKSDDTQTMVTILQTLGIGVEEKENVFIVHGNIHDVLEQSYEINVQVSGRTARIILAFLCIVPGIKIVNCHKTFEKRPIGDLVDGLRQLGAEITYLKQNGFLPVKITSNRLSSGTINIKGNISSQYISALLLIAPAIGKLIIEVSGKQVSKPFIDITTDVMKSFGVEVVNQEYKTYIVTDKQYINPLSYAVESDATAASYFWAIAAITKSTITVCHIDPFSKQGDIQYIRVLEQMGCKIEKNSEEKWIRVTGTEILKGITVDMSDLPDVVPTLAVVAAFAKGTTHITGLLHLKVKESDRIEAPKNELLKMGITASTTKKSLTIYGHNPKGTAITTYGDHRIAMAFAVAGAQISGMEIMDANVVSKSFPDFWKKLEDIGIKEEKHFYL